MYNIEDINIDDIDFIKVDRYVEANDADYLEYTIWMKPVDIGIRGYKIVQTIERAFEILSSYNTKGVLSDYYVEELQDKEVMSAIMSSRTTVDAIVKEDIEVRLIEFRPRKNSIYNNLYKINEARGRIKTVDSDNLSPATMLNFNEANFNISHRYYDKGKGFKTYFIVVDDKVRDFEVETVGKVDLLCRMEKDLKNGRFQYLISGEDLDINAYDFYFDGKLINRNYIHLFLPREVLINYFARSFKSLICKKTADAVYQVSAGIEPSRFISSGYSGKTTSEKKCTVKHSQRILSTTVLYKMFREYGLHQDYEGNLNGLLKHLESSFHQQTSKDIIATLINYNNMTPTNRVIKSKLDSIYLGTRHISDALRSVCLKQVISGNELSEKMFGFDELNLESYITDATIRFQLHQSREDTMKEYMRELLNN